jgi:hypothetical protein
LALERLALVTKSGSRWRLCEGVDWDVVAAEIGTQGRGAKQAARHRQERLAYEINVVRPYETRKPRLANLRQLRDVEGHGTALPSPSL